MALRITMGQYYPADSPIHRLDPRTKLLCGLAVMVLVFFIRSPWGLALGYAAMTGAVIASRVPLSKVARAVRPLVVMLLVLSVFNLLFRRDGDVLLSAGPLVVTTGGVQAAFLFSLRLVIGVVAATLLLLTTTPTRLTDACDALLAPLARIGLPAHELAMVFSLMLRFIPTLADEAGAIMDAQASRGGALSEGSLVQRVKAVVPVVVALLASSVRHANGLSRALDARCYEGGAARGHWHPLRFGWQDGVAFLLTTLYGVAIVLLG